MKNAVWILWNGRGKEIYERLSKLAYVDVIDCHLFSSFTDKCHLQSETMKWVIKTFSEKRGGEHNK